MLGTIHMHDMLNSHHVNILVLGNSYFTIMMYRGFQVFTHQANVKIGGYDVPKGSNVHVNVWAIARDPAIWKNPNEFRPERLLEEDVDTEGHDFRLLPFGASRRECPRAQLGVNLVTPVLGHLLHHFSWAPPKGVNSEEIDMSENPGMVTYLATLVEVMPTPRLPSHLYML
ncbi:hypothetical protein ACFX13_045324 [Malus domestica]